MLRSARFMSSIALTAVIGACAKEASISEVSGGCADVYTAQVCTFASMKGTAVLEVGATVPIASIQNSPTVEAMVWPPVANAVLDVPEPARNESGLTHFTMYWEASGHPPGPYMQPHFDFHFYIVPNASRTAIDCKDVTKPAALPAGYALLDIPLPPDMAKMTGVSTLVGTCVPQMGMHSLPAAELESKDPFRGDMVVGSYAGKTVFIEPMVTKAMLMEKKSFDLPIPTIPGIGAHPTKFHAEFDAAKQSYRFALSGFVPAA